MQTAVADSEAGKRYAAEPCDGVLRRFLQAYWLRPENALWMTLRSLVLDQVRLLSPSIDLGCGDGVFSFLHCGGVFDPDFHVFASVGHLHRVRDEHADMFDFVNDGYQPAIIQTPGYSFDVGVDLKAALLAKARRISFYADLIEHDLNQPLPFASRSFQTLYCNTAYWVSNIDGFLSELRRITRDDGQVILQVKLSSMGGSTLAPFREVLGGRLLDIISRGRQACWVSLTDRATWERRFRQAGLTVGSVAALATKTHAHLWDIGLRPIAPLLVKMTEATDPATRTAIKREWVELFLEMLLPLARPDLHLISDGAEDSEIQYVLHPR